MESLAPPTQIFSHCAIMKVNEQATSKENTVGHDTSYTYRMVSRVFRIPFRGGVAPEKGILNMSDIILYVFCIMAANQLCLF